MHRPKLILVFVLLAVCLLFYRNHLLYYFQLRRLRPMLSSAAPASNTNKISFCSAGPYPKVWAHRVNSLQRFEFLSQDFQGFELDIMFDKENNFFDVRHPPDLGISLSFESYLKMPGSSEKFFWLDLKNLTNANEQAILNLLAQLDRSYKLRERVIIESDNIQQLSLLSAAGYFTSYYYDRESYDRFLASGTKTITDSVFARIDAVSQDVMMYDTLRQLFPAKPKLTWALAFKNYYLGDLFDFLQADKQVLIYLVNIKSPGYR